MAKEIDPKELRRFDLTHCESKCYLSSPAQSGLSAIEVIGEELKIIESRKG
ncbi:MAG: hypothetical protein JSU85_15920 [Candidatus Zixiibacteriota bacterium]|nr:MAG: hypothetical protein JSU85_15920 [candidate division Zixibacteria bacterium]